MIMKERHDDARLRRGTSGTSPVLCVLPTDFALLYLIKKPDEKKIFPRFGSFVKNVNVILTMQMLITNQNNVLWIRIEFTMLKIFVETTNVRSNTTTKDKSNE